MSGLIRPIPQPRGFFRFWRTPWLPAVLSILLVVVVVPVFLRMPLWCDVTLYDVAARAILGGGVHYRDVFDTNTPGYVWCLTVLRATLGTSTVAVRAVDLAVFAGVVALLDRLAKLGGGTRASRWWAIAGMVSFYPFSTEFVHAQRDIWLALPMLAALFLRLRRIGKTAAGVPVGYFWPAFAEGLLWAAAVWIKPHVIPLALFVWLLTVRRLSGGSRRIARRDLAGNLAAGIALGLAGVAFLVASGTWPHFWIVMTEWNGHYTDIIFEELGSRLHLELHWFPPWSILLVPSLLLVALSLIDGRVFSTTWLPTDERGPMGREISGFWYDPAPDDAARFARAVLAGAYLFWAVESFVLQRAFLYVHVTETLMMIALWAAHRWCLPAFVLAWVASFSLFFRLADDRPEFQATARQALAERGLNYEKLDLHYRHALAEPGYAGRWLACFRTPLTGQDDARLKDTLKVMRGHVATTNWEELGEVEAFLRSQDVKDRELVCWDEGVHPLYLALGVRPGFRFMHVHNADNIGPNAPQILRAELLTNPDIRFVVSDLEWVSYVERRDRSEPYGPGRADDDLVPELPPKWGKVFPYDGRKTVFRSQGGLGRYVVFAVSAPLGKVE